MDVASLKSNKLSLPDDYLQFAHKELRRFDYFETIGTYSSKWTIENFSKLSEMQVEGPTFKTDQHSWKLVIFPKGNRSNQNNRVSLFLQNVDCKNKSSTKDVCAVAALCIVDPRDPTHIFHKVIHNRFNQDEADWGYSDFISLDILLGQEKPYMHDDTFVIVPIIQVKKDTTGVLWHNFTVYNSKETTGYVGLYNQGATCYMNSLFQSLFFTNIYRKSVYQIPTENDDPSKSVALALQRLFYNLQFSDTTVSTTEITKSFGWNSYDSFMQHDVQEFNRILQEHIEKKTINTPAEGTIKEIFVGKTKSYVKCLHVDYESSKSEEFYDIQLNVKGCQDLRDSFEDYVREEILEKENKYMADEYGLQDAKKGVVFETVPPVLQVQLKRFEYDIAKDIMVKINDRHEFPAEIDLQPYHILRDQLSGPSLKYILHGVLVHSGSLSSGHYFSFVRPSKEDKWFEFNDDRVTPVTLDQVFEDNYGGQAAYAKFGTGRKVIRETNAYMLVYIRDSCQDQVLEPVTVQDIPQHLIQRIEQEKMILAGVERLRSEQHLYMSVEIVTDDVFLTHKGVGFISDSDHTNPHVQQQRALRSQRLGDFIREYASKNTMDMKNTRIWFMDFQEDDGVEPRPIELLSTNAHNIPLEELCPPDSDCYPTLRLYIERFPIQTPPVGSKDIILFAKFFDPNTQTLHNVGKLFVMPDDMISTVQDTLNAMIGGQRGTQLSIFYEIDRVELQPMVMNWPFENYRVTNGDIIGFQVHQNSKRSEALLAEGKCPDMSVYYELLRYRIDIQFQKRDVVYHHHQHHQQQQHHQHHHQQHHQHHQQSPSTPLFTLQLGLNMSVGTIISKLACYTKSDPKCIQLLYRNGQGRKPLLRSVLPGQFNATLEDLLQLCPEFDLDDVHFDVKEVRWTLYYDVLPMSLEMSRRERLIRIQVCYTFRQQQPRAILLSLFASVSDLCRAIEPNRTIRIYKVDTFDLSTVHVLNANQTIRACIKKDEEDLYAEITPHVECNIGQDDFYITVYHYEENLTQTHSIPFRFLIIKDEMFNQTKRRLQERVGLDDLAWSKVGFTTLNRYSTVKAPAGDGFKTSDLIKSEYYSLGLEHPDPQGRYCNTLSKNSYDKGLYIKN